MASTTHNFISDLWMLTKPRLSLLVIITAAGGWWMAPVYSHWTTGIFCVVGTTLTVWSANVFNNYLEKDSDGLMARTKSRPLPTKRMKPLHALIFGIALSIISIPMLTLTVNPLCALLGGIALISYVLVYTPLKRISSFNTIVGAIPGAMPPLMGWVAATNEIDIGGVALFAILFLWQIPHFLAISMYRDQEYANAGLIVLPNVRGFNVTRQQMLLYTTFLLPLPFFLSTLKITGVLTALFGSALGLWWLYLACIGFFKGLGSIWARKFFFASLIYLVGLFAVIFLDVLLYDHLQFTL